MGALPEGGGGPGEDLQGLGQWEAGPLPGQDHRLAALPSQDTTNPLHDTLTTEKAKKYPRIVDVQNILLFTILC